MINHTHACFTPPLERRTIGAQSNFFAKETKTPVEDELMLKLTTGGDHTLAGENAIDACQQGQGCWLKQHIKAEEDSPPANSLTHIIHENLVRLNLNLPMKTTRILDEENDAVLLVKLVLRRDSPVAFCQCENTCRCQLFQK